MRNDLDSMNPGKAAAQACHAANKMVRDVERSKLSPLLKKWESEAVYFGTTWIKRGLLTDIERVWVNAWEHTQGSVAVGIVIDSSYPVRDGVETHLVSIPTAMYVFGPMIHVSYVLRMYNCDEWMP